MERPPIQPTGPSAMEIAKIRVCVKITSSDNLSMFLLTQAAIASAKSLEEVQQLEAMLKAGQIPGQVVANSHGRGTEEDEMDN